MATEHSLLSQKAYLLTEVCNVCIHVMVTEHSHVHCYMYYNCGIILFLFQAMEMDGGKLSSHGALPVSSGLAS